MPNAIKYNTSAETLALKKGNFWIGTGDVGKGPTSSTGFYNGLTPPSGGYTIYLNKASGGPSIYTVSTVAQLTGLTSSIAGQTLTTSGACLNWFATQTDKMILNNNYPPIVTNGLVLNLDAGFTPSYPTTATTWYDVSSSGNNGTLTNGPTFNSANNGSILFDGVDDYVSLSNYPIPNNFSYSIWVKVNGNGPQGTRGIVISNGSTYIDINAGNYILFSLMLSNASQNLIASPYGVFAALGVWAHYTVTYNRQQAKLYFNGSEVASSNYTLAPYNDLSAFTVGCYAGGAYNLNGNISIAQMYDKALTAAEIAQNYCATVPIVTNGLVLNIDAGTQLSYVNGSTAWVDTAGNTVGTLTNGPTYNSSNLGSIVFDGVDDVIIWNSNPLSSLTSAKTYDVWIKFNNSNINTFTLCCGTLQVYIENGGTWYVNQSGAVNSYLTWTYSSGWTNFIYSFDGTNHLCYINGVAKTINFGSGVGSQTNLYIGNRVNMDSPMKGNIATTRVYNRGLSATEILQNYNASKGRFGL